MNNIHNEQCSIIYNHGPTKLLHHDASNARNKSLKNY
jgi:hypothetical protein